MVASPGPQEISIDVSLILMNGPVSPCSCNLIPPVGPGRSLSTRAFPVGVASTICGTPGGVGRAADGTSPEPPRRNPVHTARSGSPSRNCTHTPESGGGTTYIPQSEPASGVTGTAHTGV